VILTDYVTVYVAETIFAGKYFCHSGFSMKKRFSTNRQNLATLASGS